MASNQMSAGQENGKTAVAEQARQKRNQSADRHAAQQDAKRRI